ncbi:MAG: hypothetical protein ABGX43_06265 [Nitrospinaceae bacterium]|nr:hypothetical protein [Nitrospinaceae bacterium]
MIELSAISQKTYPCREIEMGERLTGENESGWLSEIANTIKLAIIEMTSVKKIRSSIIPFHELILCHLFSIAIREGYSLTFLS